MIDFKIRCKGNHSRETLYYRPIAKAAGIKSTFAPNLPDFQVKKIN